MGAIYIFEKKTGLLKEGFMGCLFDWKLRKGKLNCTFTAEAAALSPQIL
jgi:hypothetical protein